MTQEAKLKKIIEKAVKGGWKPLFNRKRINKFDSIDVYSVDTVSFCKGNEGKCVDVVRFIFSHSFAKAIWGEEEAEVVSDKAWVSRSDDLDDLGKKKQVTLAGKLYELNLMFAVISENPIDYFYENMEAI